MLNAFKRDENDEIKALDVLLANAICSDNSFTCSECPLCVEGEEMELCRALNDKNIHEAIKILIKKSSSYK